jgi:ABC-2 type transport system permease protein
VSTVAVLLRADVRGFLNRMRRMERRRMTWLLIAAPILAPAVLAPAVAVGAAMAALGASSASGVMTLGFTTLGMVMLIVGLSSVMVAFFSSRDLLLLAGAPIRLADIYAARLVVAARASVLLAALLFAAVIGYGANAGVGIAYWIASPVMVLCIVFGITALQVALLGAVVRVVPMARARTMVSVVAALLGSAFWMVWLLLRTGETGGVDTSLTQTAAGAAGLGEHLVWLPTAWPARALAGFATGDVAAPLWLLTTLIATGVLLMLGHAVFVTSFRRGLSALGEVPRRAAAPSRSRMVRPRSAWLGWRAPRRSPLRALVHKEWVVMRRDPRRLAALIPLCAIAAVYPLIGPGSNVRHVQFWSGVLRGGSISLMLPFFFTQILAAPAVALEGRAFMLLRLAPVDVGLLLRAKVIAVTLPMAAATAVACVVLGVSRHGDATQVATLVLMGMWLAVGATTIGVSGGAIGARFDVEDPRRAVSIGAALGSTVASLAFLGLSIIAALQITRATGLVSGIEGVTGGDSGTAMGGAVVALAIAVGIVVLMTGLAQRRLAQWQPDGSRAPLVAPLPSWGQPGA